MESWGMIIGGYVVVFGVVVAYAAIVIRRGRQLAAQLRLDDTHPGGDVVGDDHQDSRWTQ